MNEGLIPSRYAKALHLYAEEAGKAAAVYEQTERLAVGYEAHPQMSRAVENPFLPLADKMSLHGVLDFVHDSLAEARRCGNLNL